MRVSSGYMTGVFLLAVAGCTERQLGLPRIEIAARSPNGLHEGLVRNHPSPDPPQQSLWLRDTAGPTNRLRDLSGDQDWCNTIVWSSDSSRVGFLVQDAWLLVYDVASRKLVAGGWLVPQDGYPTTRDARVLSLGVDGRSVTFQACPRNSSECDPPRTMSLTN